MTEEQLQELATATIERTKEMVVNNGGVEPVLFIYTTEGGALGVHVVPIPGEVIERHAARRFTKLVIDHIGLKPVALILVTEITMTSFEVPKDSPVSIEEIHARIKKEQEIPDEYKHLEKIQEGFMVKFEMPGVDKMQSYEIKKNGRHVEFIPMEDEWITVQGGNYHNLIEF